MTHIKEHRILCYTHSISVYNNIANESETDATIKKYETVTVTCYPLLQNMHKSVDTIWDRIKCISATINNLILMLRIRKSNQKLLPK